MPAWDVGGVSDSPPETRKTKEGRSWVTWVGVGRQWLVTGWLEVSRLSQSITKWGVLPLCAARQPFQKIYVLEGHKGSQKVVKTKSGVELWFRSHPNSLSSVGKPNKAGCLSLSAGKMAAQMTHAAFIWGSVLLLVCLSSFSFYLKNHPFMWKGESYSPGPSRTDKTRPREIPFIPWPSSPVFPWGPQILGGLRVTAQGRNSLYAKIFATPGRSFNLMGLPVPIINKTGRIQGIQGTGQIESFLKHKVLPTQYLRMSCISLQCHWCYLAPEHNIIPSELLLQQPLGPYCLPLVLTFLVLTSNCS